MQHLAAGRSPTVSASRLHLGCKSTSVMKRNCHSANISACRAAACALINSPAGKAAQRWKWCYSPRRYCSQIKPKSNKSDPLKIHVSRGCVEDERCWGWWSVRRVCVCVCVCVCVMGDFKLFWSLSCISTCVSQLSAHDWVCVFPDSFCIYGFVCSDCDLSRCVFPNVCEQFDGCVYAWLNTDVYVCRCVWLFAACSCPFYGFCVCALCVCEVNS